MTFKYYFVSVFTIELKIALSFLVLRAADFFFTCIQWFISVSQSVSPLVARRSVRRSFSWSVGWSVGRFVVRSVGPFVGR